MHTFFTPFLDALSPLAELPADEAHHALQVLRLKSGDEIRLINGRGLTATARLLPSGKKKAQAEIVQLTQADRPKPRITVFLGLLKNRQRMEWAVEKLTETGVQRIILGDTTRTERQKLRTDRLESVALSAAKQSLTAWIPEISTASLAEIMREMDEAETGHIPVIAHEKIVEGEGGRSSRSFRELISDREAAEATEWVLFIGPEGGFTDEEVSRLSALPRARLLHLGPQRLRAETAAVVCAALFGCSA